MSTNINRSPFLRTSREIPEELHQLTVEVNKAYVEIAAYVNDRIIGLFPTIKPAITGEAWFLTNARQQSQRQVYIVPSGIISGSTINLGFKISSISQFSPKCYGTFTDGTNWYGLIFASNIPIAGQVSFFLNVNGASTTTDQIVFEVGAGAPAISSGTVLVEWLANV